MEPLAVRPDEFLGEGAPVDDFPVEGITLNGIRHFIQAHGGEENFIGLRTTEVCERFLKPATVGQLDSYCLAFKNDHFQTGNIAKATVFVSHAWGHEFLDVVAALEAYDSKQATPTVFWFDIFSNNQHKAHTREFTWWQTVFRNNIGKLKRTLLVLEWDDPKPLKRAWCLWEMVSTVNTESDFQVLMSPRNEASFVTALMEDFDNLVYKTCNVNLKEAEAFNPSDRDNIFKAVEASAGFERVNQQVIGIMRDWMTQRGLDAMKGLPKGDYGTSTLPIMLSLLLSGQGRTDVAIPILRETLDTRRGGPDKGKKDAVTLTVMFNLGNMLQKDGQVEEAGALHEEALEARRELLGPTHSDTLASMFALIKIRKRQGNKGEVFSLQRELLTTSKSVFGDSHPKTLLALAELAGSDPEIREEFQSQMPVGLELGVETEDEVVAFNNLGLLLHQTGKSSLAERCFRKALEGGSRVLGWTHPLTLSIMNNLGNLLLDSRQLEEASTLYDELVKARLRTLGDTHPNTLNTFINYSILLQVQGNIQKAQSILQETLEKCCSALGQDHPTTIRCREILKGASQQIITDQRDDY